MAEIATQQEAEAGTDNTTLMTPLRTAQSIDSRRPAAFEPETYAYLRACPPNSWPAESQIYLNRAIRRIAKKDTDCTTRS